MKWLDTATIVDGDKLVDASGRKLSFNRLCTTTWVLKGLRTKYCTMTGACVEEFDHFCGWLNTAIGKGNHRPFIVLAVVEASTQSCHLYCLVYVAFQLVKYDGACTQCYHGASQWLWAMLWGYPLICVMVALQGLTAPGIWCLALNQLRMIGVNLTTNETMNYKRYEHFWQAHGDGQHKVFVNPFNKGNPIANCVDFWWTRTRGEEASCCTAH